MGLETIAVIGIVAAVAGGTVGAVGSIQAADAAEKQGKYAQRAANANASVALQQAQAEAAQVRDRNKRVMASQRTSFLKSGITLDGTPGDVIYDSAVQGELDALNTLYRGDVSANAAYNQGTLAKMGARSQSSAYRYQAAGSALGAVSGAASSYSYASSQPKFGSSGTTIA